MTFLSDPTIRVQELLLASDRIAIVESTDRGARRFGPDNKPRRSKVVPMRAVVPSLKAKARKETSEFDRDFSW
jgi:hypothetical protein